MINMIHGGPSGGQSGHKRKELAHEGRHEVFAFQSNPQACPITFSDADLQDVHLPYNDALVIAPLIDHITVHRVLIDRGFSQHNNLSTYTALGWDELS